MYLERLNRVFLSLFISFFVLFCPQHAHMEIEEAVEEEVYVSVYILGTLRDGKNVWVETTLKKIRINLWNIYNVPRRSNGKAQIFIHRGYLSMICSLLFKKLYRLLAPKVFSSSMILSY